MAAIAAAADRELVLKNGSTRLAVHPNDGGKLVSLEHDGIEWLAPSVPRDSTGVYAGGGGWDECIPTIAACDLPGGSLRDHGDAWRREWTVLAQSESSVVAALALDGVQLTRTVTITRPGAVSFFYEATSREGVHRLYWAAHPLFDAPSGTRIEYLLVGPASRLPDGVKSSFDGSGIDSLDNGSFVKVFASHLQAAALVRPDGSRLQMTWAGRGLRGAGLYWDRGVFMANRSLVAIEPTTSLHDSAAEERAMLPTLAFGESTRWRISCMLTGPR